MAIQSLASQVHADRLGVWLTEAPASGSFRGLLWDTQQDIAAAEESQLSPEIASFLGPLGTAGSMPESSLGVSPDAPMIGPLVEMRRALWIPVKREGLWQGLLMAASRRRDAAFPRRVLEGIAEELSLALVLEEERRAAASERTDLAFFRKWLAGTRNGASPEDKLSLLVEDCVSALGAEFAAIGRLTHPDAPPEFPWESGDHQRQFRLESGLLHGLCGQALETGRIVGKDTPSVAAAGGFARFVGLPLADAGERLGVLVATFRGAHPTPAMLERLELRAGLAAEALAQKNESDRKAQRSAHTLAFLRKQADPLLLLDARGCITSRSDGAQFLLGAPAAKERVLLFDLFRPADGEALARWWQSALAQGEVSVSPQVAVLRSGVPVRLHTPIPIGEGLFAVALEEAASNSPPTADGAAEADLRTLLEWLEQGVLLFDAHQRIRAMNSRFVQIAGLDQADVGRIHTLDALVERMSENAAEPASLRKRWNELASLEESGVREEIPLARPSPRILERAARPILDAAGRRLGWLEIYRDLTAQRVFQSKLLQTEKLAALGQMVTGIAHELSNPLSAILGNAQRLLQREEHEPREEIRHIYQEAERAGRILRQLLDSGRDVRPERRPVSLNQIVLRALELQRFRLSPGKIRVEMHLEPTAPLVLGDPDQLQQVVTNLFVNAQQAIEQEPGPGTIRIETQRTPEHRLQLRISDTGPGIPLAILARIFDPFFTTKPAGVGTGLGLSIVLGIVREHGGLVRVANHPEGGAMFTVEFPDAVQESSPSQAVVPSRTEHPLDPVAAGTSVQPAVVRDGVSPAEAFGAQKARVLVVEDEPTVARLIADVLADEGLEADVRFDAREALQQVAQSHYDLVICDLKMPGLDGQHFYQALVRIGSPLRNRVIFVSGGTLSPPLQEFLEHHHLAYVAKPFRVDELAQAVHDALRNAVPLNSKSAAVRNL